MREGIIVSVKVDRRFGFVGAPGEPDCFFLASQLRGLEWNEQLEGMRVRFDVVSTPRGFKAYNVRSAD